MDSAADDRPAGTMGAEPVQRAGAAAPRRASLRQTGSAALFGVFVLLILGLSMTAGMRYVGSRVGAARQQSTERELSTKVQKALENFVAKKFRLPCPADGTLTATSALYGLEQPNGGTPGGSCSFASGAPMNAGIVPWKSIGLQPPDAIDAWGNWIGYAVTPALTGSGIPKPPFSAPVLPPNGIQVCVTNVNGGCPNAAKTTPYAYVLISFGPSGGGAYNTAGTQLAAPVNAVEKQNAQAAAFLGTTPFVSEPSNAASGSTFGNILRFETVTQVCQDVRGAKKAVSACLTQAAIDTAAALNATTAPQTGYDGNMITAGSLANPLPFVECVGSGTSCSNQAGQLTLKNGLGIVTVTGPGTNGISTGNAPANALGDWIGANNQYACAQCPYNTYNPGYLVPNQYLNYQLTQYYSGFAFVDYLLDGGMTVKVTAYTSATPADQTTWQQVGTLTLNNGPYTDNLHSAPNSNPACLGPYGSAAPPWLKWLQPTYTVIPANNGNLWFNNNDNSSSNIINTATNPGALAPWSGYDSITWGTVGANWRDIAYPLTPWAAYPTNTPATGVYEWHGYPPSQLAQQWPTVALGSNLDNYYSEFDNQFVSHQFYDQYGNPQLFNILQFSLLPYLAISANGDGFTLDSQTYQTSNGSNGWAYGMLFEGMKACPTYAAETLTIGGTPTVGDIISVTFTNDEVTGWPVTVSYTVAANDTTTTIAAQLAFVINTNQTLRTAYIVADSFYPRTNNFGPVVNLVQESNTNIAVLSMVNAQVSTSGTETVSLAPGNAAPTLTLLGVPTIGDTVAVTLSNPNIASLPVTKSYTVTVNDAYGTGTLTVGGTTTSGDIISVTFTNSQVSGSPVTVSYTVTGADTPTTIAAQLTALISGNQTLSTGFNMVATNSGLTVNLVEEGNIPVITAQVSGMATETVWVTSVNAGLNSIASHLAALINADPVLQAACLSANPFPNIGGTGLKVTEQCNFTVAGSTSLTATVTPGATDAVNGASMSAWLASAAATPTGTLSASGPLNLSPGANICDMRGNGVAPTFSDNTAVHPPGDQWWNPPTGVTMDCSLQPGMSLK